MYHTHTHTNDYYMCMNMKQKCDISCATDGWMTALLLIFALLLLLLVQFCTPPFNYPLVYFIFVVPQSHIILVCGANLMHTCFAFFILYSCYYVRNKAVAAISKHIDKKQITNSFLYNFCFCHHAKVEIVFETLAHFYKIRNFLNPFSSNQRKRWDKTYFDMFSN